MIEVTIVYNDDSQIKKLGDTYSLKGTSPSFVFLDERTLKGRKKGWSVKSHWAAKETPFAVVKSDEKVLKVFYSEGGDVIKLLINYLNTL